jgi:hypothetical protein
VRVYPTLIVRDGRCPYCKGEAVPEPDGRSLRHKAKTDCTYRLGYDLPSDVCCRVLAAFGYPADRCPDILTKGGKNTAGKPDASNEQKLTDLILETRYGVVRDWRGDPDSEFLNPLVKIAALFGVQIKWKYIEDDVDGVALSVSVDGKTRRIKGRSGPASVALPEAVYLARRVERASGGRLVTRVATIYECSDTWGYVMLSPERWRTVDEAAGEWLPRIFVVRDEWTEPFGPMKRARL